jgi:hypothetical protein
MPIDDELGALERQFEIEDATSIPFAGQIIEGTSALLSVLSLGGPKAQIFLGQIKRDLRRTSSTVPKSSSKPWSR